MVEPPAEPHSYRTVVFVMAALVVAVLIAVEALSTGRLYVLVDVAGEAEDGFAPIVCVYEGDVSDVLEAGDASAYPQALVAASVEIGIEEQLEGSWRGTYTVAVFTQAGELDERAPILVVQAGKDETHAAFMVEGQ